MRSLSRPPLTRAGSRRGRQPGCSRGSPSGASSIGILVYVGNRRRGQESRAASPPPSALDGKRQAAATCEAAIRQQVRGPFRVIAFRSALVAEERGGYTVSGTVELQSIAGDVQRSGISAGSTRTPRPGWSSTRGNWTDTCPRFDSTGPAGFNGAVIPRVRRVSPDARFCSSRSRFAPPPARGQGTAVDLVVSYPPDLTLVEKADLPVEGYVRIAGVEEIEIVVNDDRPVRATVRDRLFAEEVSLEDGLNTVRIGPVVRRVWLASAAAKPPAGYRPVYGHFGLNDGCLECHETDGSGTFTLVRRARGDLRVVPRRSLPRPPRRPLGFRARAGARRQVPRLPLPPPLREKGTPRRQTAGVRRLPRRRHRPAEDRPVRARPDEPRGLPPLPRGALVRRAEAARPAGDCPVHRLPQRRAAAPRGLPPPCSPTR